MSAADIKGWMTLQQVMNGMKITQAVLDALMSIPPDGPPATALKELEKIVPGFEVSVLGQALTAP